MQPDVIVIGLGSMGGAAAYHLARRGIRVRGLDRFVPPHDRGAHGGGSRIIRLAYLEGASYVPLIRRAYALWRETEEAAGADLVTTTGGLMIGRPESATIAGTLDSATTYGLAHEMLDAAEVTRRFPALRPAEDEVAVYEEVAGLVCPEAAVDAHLTLAAHAGADLRYGEQVTGWRATEHGVTVTTVRGEHHADRLVVCPGPWAPDLLADLGVPYVVERQVQHYWDPAGDPADLAPGALPVWLWDNPERGGRHGYGFPLTRDGVKTAFHHGGARVDADTVDRDVHDDEVMAMRAWLASRVPGAAGRWRGGKVCLYANTPDENFLIGTHPRRPRTLVAAGFSGHGFKFAPVVGEILADLVTTGTTAHPIGLFDPARFDPAPSDPAGFEESW